MSVPVTYDELCNFFGARCDDSNIFFFFCTIKIPKTGRIINTELRFAENMYLIPIIPSSFNVPIDIHIDNFCKETAVIYPYSVTKDENGYDELTGQISCLGELMNYSIMIC